MPVVCGTPSELGCDSSRVAEFYRLHWPKRTPLADVGLYDYLFRQRAGDDSPEPEATIIALDRGSGDIVAAMAARNRRFTLPDGGVVKGVEMSTWLVRPDQRASGAGVKVLSELRQRADVCVGASITPEARDIYLRLGFRWQPALPRYVFAPDWTAMSTHLRDAHLALRVQKARQAGTVRLAPDLTTIDIASLTGPRYIGRAAAFDRSTDLLNWRFGANPFFQYRAVRIGKGASAASIVYRKEALGSLTALRAVDMIGELDMMPHLPFALETLCQEEQASFVDFFCSHVDAADAFASAGWFTLPADECVMDVPHLLSPPVTRSPNSYSCVIWMHPRLAGVVHGSALYLTKQDCDMDRRASVNHV